jgi:hypothetical protein
MLKWRIFEDMQDLIRNAIKKLLELQQMNSKCVPNNFLSEHKVCDISRTLFKKILKDIFGFKCGYLKIDAALEINFLTLYFIHY